MGSPTVVRTGTYWAGGILFDAPWRNSDLICFAVDDPRISYIYITFNGVIAKIELPVVLNLFFLIGNSYNGEDSLSTFLEAFFSNISQTRSIMRHYSVFSVFFDFF